MKVLVSAFACEPDKGSEGGVGWNWVCQIARYHEVWAITRKSHREAIESALAKEPQPNVHWIYFDLPRSLCFWQRGGLEFHLYYYFWQAGAYFKAKGLCRRNKFDAVHHVTYATYWRPSFMALLPAPFVWGPVGGGESVPRAFYSSLSLKGRRDERLRDIGRALAHFDPFVRLTARRSVYALAATKDTEKRLVALGCRKVLISCNSGLPADDISSLKQVPFRHDNPFRVFSIGNLLPSKGFDLGVRAFAEFHRQFPSSQYWLIGEGPERNRLERLASELGVHRAVGFLGALPRSEVIEKLTECDVLLHPSLHDSAGWVCLEAMAAGRPVVCLDLGGPSLLVAHETGIKVAAHSPKQAVSDLAAALSHLASNTELRLQLGQAGRQRIKEHFDYGKKVGQLMEIYQGALRIAAHAGD
jgi:glycosyltransferase involved in cell wall biosynthesis